MVVRARIHESRAPIVSGQFKDSPSHVNFYLLPLIESQSLLFFTSLPLRVCSIVSSLSMF